MCPWPAGLVTGEKPALSAARLVCHCLLIESSAGLVLVDTGIGLSDIKEPRRRLSSFFLRVARPRLDPERTAFAQIQKLGFRPDDVRHIVLTHAHVDHAGGIADFPHAAVHLYAREAAAALTPADRHERLVYRRVQWSHGPRWSPRELEGDRWEGFDAVRAVPELRDEVLLVPLTGHTRGHAGVAVRTASGWMLHAGDTYLHHRQLEGAPAPLALAAHSRLTDLRHAERVRNLERLRALHRERGRDVRIFCAQDAVEFDRARSDILRAADRPS